MPCTITPLGEDSVKIAFDDGVYFPALGQSVVFYDENGLVIGGGIIDNYDLVV